MLGNATNKVKIDLFTYIKRDETTGTVEFHGDTVLYGEGLLPFVGYGWCMDKPNDKEYKTYDCQIAVVNLFKSTTKDAEGNALTSEFEGIIDTNFSGDFPTDFVWADYFAFSVADPDRYTGTEEEVAAAIEALKA